MLSQVERGETSPTLAVAAKIAAGLELTLSQLLRLDEDSHVVVVRRGEGRSSRRGGHRVEELTPALPGPARRGLAAHARSRDRDRRSRRPADARAGQPRDDLRRAPAPPCWRSTASDTSFARATRVTFDADLPHHFENEGDEAAELRGRRRGRAAGGASGWPRRCSRRSGRRTRSPTASSTSTCTSCTRSPRRRPSTGCGSRAAPCAAPTRRVATADHNVPTDGTAVARLIADELSRTQVETLERNCEEFGIPIYSLGSERQGIVHVIGPELGLTQPGMTIVCGDSPHLHPRRLRRARVRDRHLRGRARARDPVPGAEAPEVDADRLLGRAWPGRHPQGPDPGDDRPPRHRRDAGPRRRVRGRGDPGPADGGADDDLQHDDRGRRARGDDRPGRDDLRVDGGPAGRSGRLRRGGRALARASDRGRARASTPRSRSTPRRSRRWSPGEPTPGRWSRSPTPSPIPQNETARSDAPPVHGARARHADAGDPARPRLHRLVHELAHPRPARGGRGRSRAARSPTRSRRWSSPARAGQGARPRPRGWTRSSGRPDSTGAAPAARCAWG